MDCVAVTVAQFITIKFLLPIVIWPVRQQTFFFCASAKWICALNHIGSIDIVKHTVGHTLYLMKWTARLWWQEKKRKYAQFVFLFFFLSSSVSAIKTQKQCRFDIVFFSHLAAKKHVFIGLSFIKRYAKLDLHYSLLPLCFFCRCGCCCCSLSRHFTCAVVLLLFFLLVSKTRTLFLNSRS